MNSIRFGLVTNFGAIEIKRYVTTIGRLRCNIKLHSAECSDQHASLILLPNGQLKLRNRSNDENIFVNDDCLYPGQYALLSIGTIISFSGVESFRVCSMDDLPVISVTNLLELTPD